MKVLAGRKEGRKITDWFKSLSLLTFTCSGGRIIKLKALSCLQKRIEAKIHLILGGGGVHHVEEKETKEVEGADSHSFHQTSPHMPGEDGLGDEEGCSVEQHGYSQRS